MVFVNAYCRGAVGAFFAWRSTPSHFPCRSAWKRIWGEARTHPLYGHSRQITSSAARSVNIIKLIYRGRLGTAAASPSRLPRRERAAPAVPAPLCFFEGKSRTFAPCRQSNKARLMQTALWRIKGIEQQGTAQQLRGSRQTVYKKRLAGSLRD